MTNILQAIEYNVNSSSVSEYLAREKKYHPLYYRELSEQNFKLPTFESKKKIVVAVPVHTTEQNIIRLLRLYGRQRLPKQSYKIILFLNRGQRDPDFLLLEKQIAEYKRFFGDSLSVVKKTFKNPITTGYIRKYLIDLILLYINNSNTIIVCNDADIENIGNGYFSEILRLHERREPLATYKISDIPLWIKKYSNFYALLQFYQATDRGLNSIKNTTIPMRVYTYNLSFTAHTYAINNGFPADVDIGEDLTFIHKLVKQFTKNVCVEQNLQFVASQRRLILSFLLKKPLYAAWNTFDNIAIRSIEKKKLEQLLIKREVEYTYVQFQNEVESFFNYFLRYRIYYYLHDGIDQIDDSPFSKRCLRLAERTSKDIFSTVLSDMGYGFSFYKENDYFTVLLRASTS